MALIEFKNLPDTSTPLNAENLNNNFNEVKHQDITTDGEPVKCGYKIDGKDVYVKRVNFGSLPNAQSLAKPSGIDFTENLLVSINGIAINSNGVHVPIPFASNDNTGGIILSVDASGNIVITTGSDRRTFNATLNLYFISKQ